MVSTETLVEQKKKVISEFFAGLTAASVVGFLVRYIDFSTSFNGWLLALGRFIYFCGHPYLTDEDKFQKCSREYWRVFLFFFAVVARLLLVLLILLLVLGAVRYTMLATTGRDSLESEVNVFGIQMPGLILDLPFSIGAVVPLLLWRKIFASEGNQKQASGTYSVFAKFLHYVFLGNRVIAKSSLAFEQSLQRSHVLLKPKLSIYVAGLARSGSTSLMQYLGQISECSSLTYRNMPLVLMSRTGRRLQLGGDFAQTERAHGDGMMHSLDSQEALEEPFWLHFCGADYVKDASLTRHDISEDVHWRYRNMRSLIASDGIYLAKNNNHLLRARTLHQMDERCGWTIRTVVPFRHPYDQANSLLQQHRNLSQRQQQDLFVLDYMDFLGHFEFGQNLKTQTISGQEVGPSAHSPNEIEYWLEVWRHYYSAALQEYGSHDKVCFFCYENYLANPYESLKSLMSFLQIEDHLEVASWHKRQPSSGHQISVEDQALYYELLEKSVNRAAIHGQIYS